MYKQSFLHVVKKVSRVTVLPVKTLKLSITIQVLKRLVSCMAKHSGCWST